MSKKNSKKNEENNENSVKVIKDDKK